MSFWTYFTAGALLLAPSSFQAAPLWQEAGGGAQPEEARTLPDFTKAATRAMDAVVSISTVEAPAEAEAQLGSLIDPGGEEPQKGLGSGFFIHPSGYLITNAHVIEEVTGIKVSLRENGRSREYPARVLGVDPATDIALLKVEAQRQDFAVLPLGDSDQLQIADWIAAIGNPYGLTHTITVGVVSFKGRTDVMPAGREGYYDYVQTDASINPGNSGGPVINTRGEVVAIANAVNAVGQGIGFAIPINMAKQVLVPLLKNGKVTRSWIGISVEDLSPDMARELGVPADIAGVLVSEITEGAPGAQAGLQVGDVITSFSGVRVDDAQRLRWLAAIGGEGKEVKITLNRRGQAQNAVARLAAMPDDEQPVGLNQPDELGLVVQKVDVPTARSAGLALPLGARVSSLKKGLAAEKAGLLKGDLLLKVDDQNIYSANQLSRALARVRRGEIARLVVRRGEETVFIPMRRP